MTKVELIDKRIKVFVSETEKEYSLTDENGQIQIDNVILLMNDTELSNMEVEYTTTKNDEIDAGLKFFIETLFSKLKEVKQKNYETQESDDKKE